MHEQSLASTDPKFLMKVLYNFYFFNRMNCYSSYTYYLMLIYVNLTNILIEYCDGLLKMFLGFRKVYLKCILQFRDIVSLKLKRILVGKSLQYSHIIEIKVREQRMLMLSCVPL
jgi:hypothetical protein